MIEEGWAAVDSPLRRLVPLFSFSSSPSYEQAHPPCSFATPANLTASTGAIPSRSFPPALQSFHTRSTLLRIPQRSFPLHRARLLAEHSLELLAKRRGLSRRHVARNSRYTYPSIGSDPLVRTTSRQATASTARAASLHIYPPKSDKQTAEHRVKPAKPKKH